MAVPFEDVTVTVDGSTVDPVRVSVTFALEVRAVPSVLVASAMESTGAGPSSFTIVVVWAGDAGALA